MLCSSLYSIIWELHRGEGQLSIWQWLAGMCVRLNPVRIFTVNFKIVGWDRSGYLSLHLVANAQRWRRFFKRVQTVMSSNFVKPASWKGERNHANLSLARIVISSLWSQGPKPLVKFKARLCSEFVCFISHWIKASCASNRVVSVGRLNWQKLFTDACNQITIFQLRPPRAPSKCNMPQRSWHPGALHHVFSIVYEIRDCSM